MKHTVTNNTTAPQGLYEKPEIEGGGDWSAAPTYIQPGESKVLNLTGATLKAAKDVAKTFGAKFTVVSGDHTQDEDEVVEPEPAPAPAPEAFEDTLLGGQGADSLPGGNDTDTLLGGQGNDTVGAGGAADADPRTDEQLHAEYLRRTGKTFHPQSKRANWLKKLADLPPEATEPPPIL